MAKKTHQVCWAKLSSSSDLHVLNSDALLLASTNWFAVFELSALKTLISPDAIISARGLSSHKDEGAGAEEPSFPAPTALHQVPKGIQVFAGHPLMPCLAYAEKSVRPRVVVVQYPHFRELRVMPTNAATLYHSLEFSGWELLVAVTKRPKELSFADAVVWNWRNAQLLCIVPLTFSNPSHSIGFSTNPPLKLVEWEGSELLTWQIHFVCNKPFYCNSKVTWFSDGQKPVPPLLTTWFNYPEELLQLFILDSLGSLYSVSPDTGVATKLKDLELNKDPDENDPPPPLALTTSSAGLVVSLKEEIVLLKRHLDDWIVTRITVPWSSNYYVKTISVGPYKDLLWTWGENGCLHLIKPDKADLKQLIYHGSRQFTMACLVKPKGNLLAAYSNIEKQLFIINVNNGLEVNKFSMDRHTPLSLTCLPKLPVLILGFCDGSIDVLDVSTGIRHSMFLVKSPTRFDKILLSPLRPIFCVCATEKATFFLIEVKHGGSLEPLAGLEANYRVVAACLTGTTNVKLVVLAAAQSQSSSNEPCFGNVVRIYSLNSAQRKLIQEEEVVLYEDCQDMVNTTSAIYCIPFLTRTINVYDESLKLKGRIHSGHMMRRVRAFTSVSGSLLTFGADGLVVIGESGQDRDPTTAATVSVTAPLYHPYGSVLFVDDHASAVLVGELDNTLMCYVSGLALKERPPVDDLKDVTISVPPSSAEATIMDLWEEERISKLNLLHSQARLDIITGVQTLRSKIGKLINVNEKCSPESRLALAEFDLDLVGREETCEKERIRRALAQETELTRIRLQEKLVKVIMKATSAKVENLSRELQPILSPTSSAVMSYTILKPSSAQDIWGLERAKLFNEYRTDLFEPWLPRQNRLPGEGGFGSGTSRALTRRESWVQSQVEAQQLYPSTLTESIINIKPQHFLIPFTTHFQLQDDIIAAADTNRQLMEWFDKEFDSVAQDKDRELRVLSERRSRLRYVAAELAALGHPCDLPAQHTVDQTWSTTETPETITVIREDELVSPPYLSPEELEEERRLAEEAEAHRRLLAADDFRERALVAMMDGVFQKRWQDEIKKDVPIPTFMEQKAADEWTDEEKRKANVYNEAVEKLNQERERYYKLLLAELNQLQTVVQESGTKFDEKVKKLYELKLDVECAVTQEQLEVLRKREALLHKLRLHDKAAHVRDAFAAEESRHESLVEEVGKLQDLLAETAATYESLSLRERNMEKSFKKEFPEYSPIICDQLLKLSKKRPKLVGSSLSNQTLLLEVANAVTGASTISSPTCPTLPLPHECCDFLKAAEAHDSPANSPAVVTETSWDTLCRIRRNKIELELKLRAIGVDIAEGEQTLAYWQKRVKSFKDVVAKKQLDLDGILEKIQTSELDATIQIVLPLGLVEVARVGHPEEYANTSLLTKDIVQHLNKNIQIAGRHREKAMKQAGEFRKGIIYKEWEHKKLRLSVNALQAELRVLDHIHVTKELQAILNGTPQPTTEDKGISALENELKATNLRFEKQELSLRQAIDVRRGKARALDLENQRLDEAIVSLNNSLTKKESSLNVAEMKEMHEQARTRMQKILYRGRLGNKLQRLQTELARLEEERDRLSQKANPAILH